MDWSFRAVDSACIVPGVDDTEVADIEKELCRLPAVNAARIVADDIGRPKELHILAGPGKSPKQIARDVQSVAMATFGMELDHRIISVVQLDQAHADAVLAPVGQARVAIDATNRRLTVPADPR